MTTFLDCPADLDEKGTSTCGLPAEIRYRYVMTSTDGPVESAMIRCPSGHWSNGPIEFLGSHTQPRAGISAEETVSDRSGGRAA